MNVRKSLRLQEQSAPGEYKHKPLPFHDVHLSQSAAELAVGPVHTCTMPPVGNLLPHKRHSSQFSKFMSYE